MRFLDIGGLFIVVCWDGSNAYELKFQLLRFGKIVTCIKRRTHYKGVNSPACDLRDLA